MSDPVEFSIVRVHGLHNGQIVRLLAKDGPKVLVEIDIPIADYAAATLGEPVTAALTLGGKP